jgi:type VI protein secretion system component VasF
MIRRFVVAFLSFVLLAAPALAQPPSGQSEFVPLKELPPSEQLPAAPLLVTAYAVFLVLMIFYVWTVWRRLSKVETEMRALEERASKHAR